MGKQAGNAAIHISPRNRAIYRARLAGEKYESIAKRHGISTNRARQIYERWAWRVKCSLRARYIPADVLKHRWTPEDQWHELEQERVAKNESGPAHR